MELGKLLTLSFERNVGGLDRAFRMASGVGLAGAGAVMALPSWGTVALVLGGGLWALTGVLSKCSIYYLLGHSTCPLERAGESSAGQPGMEKAK